MQAESLVKFMEAVEEQIFESTLREDLSISEIVSLYIIDRMHEPTIVEFANRVHISQSNATYIIRKLINKGCLIKAQQPNDKREYHLLTTDKFTNSIDYLHQLIPLIQQNVLPDLNDEDQSTLSRLISSLNTQNPAVAYGSDSGMN